MLAGTTHDTKRSEGVRARSLALAEIADDWSVAVRRWFDSHDDHGLDAATVAEPIVTLNAEATAWFWFPLEAAAAGTLHSSITFRNTTFPAWQFEQYTVWGLTMRILAQFIA